ncbi:hypothetical protein VNO80_03073 [Phaseolus coccineus]|uniref:Uncharacterized protein n=1 Tax=Phaseolus coccineus TaxID=3886 RepID=A0AAN9RMT6_PHACN
MPLAPRRCPHASRALAMPACLSRPGDVRMSLAPWRCPHASRPGDVHIPRALAMSWKDYLSHLFLIPSSKAPHALTDAPVDDHPPLSSEGYNPSALSSLPSLETALNLGPLARIDRDARLG